MVVDSISAYAFRGCCCFCWKFVTVNIVSYSVVVGGGVIDVVDDDDCDENDVFVICFVVDCYKITS